MYPPHLSNERACFPKARGTSATATATEEVDRFFPSRLSFATDVPRESSPPLRVVCESKRFASFERHSSLPGIPRPEESMASRRGPRPAGTDGSDHQYRMVIESKYHKVSDTKKRMRTLIVLQAAYYACFFAWNCWIPMSEGKTPATVVSVMPIVGFLALVAGRRGVGAGSERTNKTALAAYILLSAVGFALAVMNAYVMQTMVHYAHSYAARFGTIMEVIFGLPQDLMQAFGQIIEGMLHASGMLLQGLGAYVAVTLWTMTGTQAKRS